MGKVLRVLAIVGMALTSAFTLLGGVGTACLAWNADKYGKAFAAFVPQMPVFQIFVYLSVLVGMAGVVAAYALLRGDKWAYWGSVVILVVGVVIAAIQMYDSSILRKVSFFDTAPTSMRFFITLLTLVLFLILRLPRFRKLVDFSAPWKGQGSRPAAGGLAAVTVGVVILTTPVWAGASHMLDGYNLVNVLQVPLMVMGTLLLLLGIGLLVKATLGVSIGQVLALIRRGSVHGIKVSENTTI
jgi:hypothetical protein